MTTIEITRVIDLLRSRGSNYDYFFQNADSTIWLRALSEKGYFENIPGIEKAAEGRYVVPFWPPIEYLVRIFDRKPDEVTNIILKFPNTDNLRILEGIMKITLKANSLDAILNFSRFITAFIENYQWGHEFIISLLRKPFIFDSRLSGVTPALLFKLVEFNKDPHEEEKRSLRKEGQDNWNTLLKPIPRFGQWQYEQILENGVRPLAEHEPYQVARILIDAVASMIRLGIHPEDVKKKQDEDYSEIWCRRLDEPDRHYQDTKVILLQTLTYACEQVYKKTPEAIDALDQTLRNNYWKVFQRLRQHLYAMYPSEQTLPWIREQILGYEYYSNFKYHYEFQLMIRKASEYFGMRLLNEEERKNIFDAILSGPSKEKFREWMGQNYNDEAFKRRQLHFHHMQLRPFGPLLSGEIQNYFDALENDSQTKDITDDSYSPYGKVEGGRIIYRSPKSTEDLEKLADRELLDYINGWNDEHRDKDDWSIEINMSALADAFQTLFKEKIVQDSERLSFWVSNRDKIKRPIYVTAVLKSMVELVKEKNFEILDKWIEFCTWVLSHPDSIREEGQLESMDEYSDWGSSCMAVVDFIGACVDKDNDVPINARESLKELLHQVCCQPDSRLDNNNRVLVNKDDPITEAINSTRGLALEYLFKFGFWVRRHFPEDNLPEVTEILKYRFAKDAKIPLTRPERALLAMHFGSLCSFNYEWAVRHREDFFPRENICVLRDTFGTYIRYNNPAVMIFKTLRDEFLYAIENLSIRPDENGDDTLLINRLGQHLFTYYLWEVYPLSGDESLLELFYNKTNGDRGHWAQLFDYVGRLLKNSSRNLGDALVDRVIAFFDWRFVVAEPMELQNFTFWLDAECFDPEWRLQSFSKILDIAPGKKFEFYIIVETLNKLLPNNLALVVECFLKIINNMSQGYTYIPDNEAKAILKAGLSAENPQIQKNAELAREKLLCLKQFDFLDLE